MSKPLAFALLLTSTLLTVQPQAAAAETQARPDPQEATAALKTATSASNVRLNGDVLALLTEGKKAFVLAAIPPTDGRHAQAQAALKKISSRQAQGTRRLVLELSAAAHAGRQETLQQFLDTALAVPEHAPELQALRPLLNELHLQAAWHGELNQQLQTLFERMRSLRNTAQEQKEEGEELDADKLLKAEGLASKEEQQDARTAREREWRGLELPAKAVLLSFDDGPHALHTPRVLATLAEHKIKALFFQLGQNLGELRSDAAAPAITEGQVLLTRNQDLVKQMVEAGHAIGNHSYSHPLMSKLTPAKIDHEIGLTQALLELAVAPGPARTAMFRAPYGALNEEVLAAIEQHHLRLVLWNVDSLDWADPSPPSIVKRVMKELEHAGRGIVLMHDIHEHTTEALPLLIKALKDGGYRFAHWNGQALEVQN